MINALLIPVIRREIDQLLYWIKMCPAHGSMPVSVLLSIDGAWEDFEREQIETTFEKSQFKDRYELHFIDCEIDPLHSCYIREDEGNFDINRIPYGMKSGPNIQFFRSFDFIRKNYASVDSVVLLEVDAYPVRTNWLAEMNNKLSWMSDHLYVAGSRTDKGLVSSNISNHINGNAVYFTKTDGFYEFLAEWERVLLTALKYNQALAYDVVLDWCYTRSLYNSELDDVFRGHDNSIAKKCSGKIISISNIILNLSQSHIYFESFNDLQTYLERNDEHLIIHGRYMWQSTDILRDHLANTTNLQRKIS